MSEDGLGYIRRHYGVPAYVGVRVRVDGGAEGEIVGSSGPHLRVQLEGERFPKIYHPTWRTVYLLPGAGEYRPGQEGGA